MNTPLQPLRSLRVLARTDSPRFMFMELNQACNLRCNHCDYWKLNDDDKGRYLSLERKFELIDEFAQLGGKVLVTCGGEPMLDAGLYFDVAGKVRATGLRMMSVINGTRVHSEARAHKMVTEGPHEITVSLDSHLEAEHDRYRGAKGSFRVAVRALRLLLDARRKAGTDSKIYAMTIVHEHNYRELDAFYDFVLNDIGADKLKLNIMQPTFALKQGAGDSFFGENVVQDTENLRQVIAACDTKYRLGINPEWLRQVVMYFESVKAGDGMGWASNIGTTEHICNTYDRNIMVDVYGNARLCFSKGFPGVYQGQYGDLTKFWHEFSPGVRKTMLGCNRFCGISHSVRREEATLKSGEKT